MKSAILGGSFNPVHKAHLLLAEAVLEIGYERIIFIPAAHPPHKRLMEGAADTQRIEMLSIALEGLEWAKIWDGEILRGGISYTIDTVRELKSSGFVEGLPGLILGDDLASGFMKWKCAASLAEETTIILARRGAEEVDFPFPCIRLRNGIWPDSSTAVRNLIDQGKDMRTLVPEGVADYIERNHLYGCD